MLRSLVCAALAALWISGTGFTQANQAPKKSALDKATLEAYVRHLFVMDPKVTLQVSDPKPSDLPGFFEVTVGAST